MKKIFVATLCAMLALTGCGSSNVADSQSGKRTLVVSTWGLSEDVLHEEVYGPFEEAYNCEIVLELGTTSERYMKLANDPNSTVDVIELSQSAAANGYEADLFEKLDYTKVPNAKDLITAAADMTQSGYGPAYAVNSIGIIYDREAVGFEIKDFSDLWNPALEGKISIPEITSTFGPAVMYMASDYKGADITTDNGAAAFEALAELKPNIVKTYSKSSDLANMFASGEIEVAIVGDFAIPTIKSAAPTVEYVSPVSGTYANFNTVDMNKNSKNKDLAYAYINWRISGELQGVTAKKLNEAPTNSTVELSEEDAANKTYGEVADKAKAIDFSFVNPILNDWIDQWNRIINS